MKQILLKVYNVFRYFGGIDKKPEEGVRVVICGNFETMHELLELDVILFGAFEVVSHNVFLDC
jgi:hypothetical protein